MAVSEDQIARCVNYYRNLLDARTGSPDSLRQAVWSGLQSIIKRAGAKRRSDVLLARLDDAFSEEGIVTVPRLTDPKIRPDERIHLFDRDRQIDLLESTRHSFPDEKSLRAFILHNRHEFEELRGLTGFETEKTMASGRRFDLFCTRPRLNQRVGIEFKMHDIDDRAIGQCLHYIDDLVDEVEGTDSSARLILISGGQPNGKARDRIEEYASRRGVAVTFLLHRVELTLSEHP